MIEAQGDRRGIILTEGSGTRLHPATLAVFKRFMPVSDKPMINYPLSVLMLAGVREVVVISTPQDTSRFRDLPGTRAAWGMRIDYAVQPKPEGLAQTFLLDVNVVTDRPSVLVLGGNLLYGYELVERLARADDLREGATVFACPVADLEGYGVVEFDGAGRAVSMEEKPQRPCRRYAVTGLYVYDAEVVEIACTIRPSARGGLDSTDVNRVYLQRGRRSVEHMGRGDGWLDTGTHDSLLDAGQFTQALEKRQRLKICCPEDIAWRNDWIDDAALAALVEPIHKSRYGEYLLYLMRDTLVY